MRYKLFALSMAVAALPMQAHTADLTLRVSYAAPFFQPAYESVAKRFMEKHPDIQIQFEGVARDYGELLQQTLRLAITGDTPDVEFAGVANLRSLAEKGIVVPLEPLIAKDPAWQSLGLGESMQQLVRVDGQVYGLPFVIAAPVLIYNKKLVTQAGVADGTLPGSWDEILPLCQRMTDLAEHITGCFFEYDSSGAWAFQTLVYSFGGKMLSDDNKSVAFNDDKGLDALGILKQFGLAGQVDMSRDQARQSFAGGTLGMIVSTDSLFMSMRQKAGGSFDVGIAPFPLSASDASLPAAGNAAVILTKDEAKQRAAWEFLKFASGPEGQSEVFKAMRVLPINDIALGDANLFEGVNAADATALKTMSEARQIDRLVPLFEFPGGNSVETARSIIERLRELLAPDAEPAKVLRQMSEDTTRLLQ